MAQDRIQKSVQGIKNKEQRKAAYYRLQRQDSEETGNQKQTDKIYSKLGKKSHNVDTQKGDKAILGTVAGTLGLRGLGAIGGAAKAAANTIKGSALAKRAGSAIEGIYQDMKPAAKSIASKSQKAVASGSQKALNSKSSPKAMTGTKQKALPAGNSNEFDGELKRLQSKPAPVAKAAKPKTFNRDGSNKADVGYKRAERSPSSKRNKA